MPPKKKVEEPQSASRFGRVKTNLRMGIVGLPNVGKSSLFNCLTETNIAEAQNFPFCTIEPNESRCAVPDERFEYLCDLWKSPSRVPAYLQVTDIAGLVKGAAEGEGLGNAFLSHITAVDGIFHVVRAFENEDVVHVDNTVDPIRDLETIQHELCKKDLQCVIQALAKEERDVKHNPQMKLSGMFKEVIAKAKELLEDNKPIKDGVWSNPEVEMITEKMPELLTCKPTMYLVNITQADFLRKKNKWLMKIHEWIKSHGGGPMIPFSIEFEEAHIKAGQEGGKDAQDAFQKEVGGKSILPKMITTGYHELNLIHFFTAGEKEIRCWTVYNGALAPRAAAVIHTDMEKGFIKAEVVSYEDFKSLQKSKGMGDVKAAGKYRSEGKKYVVADGDIIYFQHNAPTKKK
ncbi:Obg-like ATPase 1 [Diplonema papillatum]|nr:Obg-like ATPase 1 [Diplonema papillatum]KAJ9438535.1 Obg-like ATPase 1 [Diplonema papillatum]